jgi:hypothetical protein
MYMITSKLNQAWYIVRVVKPFLSLDTLKKMYYAYFHSIMTCRLIFWGNLTHIDIIFRLQKKNY